ncbi:MAG: glycosyltransferase [Coleofasciculus sp. B1-GNL1-01]|uniref:glycosyltransferase n=1 Tax=Coleofasciculus sp. B1-GNL1-01 TaxID=3068484 RepID=UPI0032F59CB1
MEASIMFKHFIITRMNVDWNLSRHRHDRNSYDFLIHRFNLFESICYPSVLSQKNKNFTWLILFDAALPIGFKQKVESYCSNSSTIKIIPVYIQSKTTLLNTVREIIQQNISSETPYLITTSIDSDDAISQNFVSLIQENFNNQDFEFINFPFGYLYRIKEQNLYLREWLTSPFYTLVENVNNFKTVLQYGHTVIKNHKNRQIITKPVWLMIAHGENVRTNFDVSAAWQPLYRLGSDFTVDLEFPSKSRSYYLKEILMAIHQVYASRKKWDTKKVKIRKIINILSPALLRFARKV